MVGNLRKKNDGTWVITYEETSNCGCSHPHVVTKELNVHPDDVLNADLIVTDESYNTLKNEYGWVVNFNILDNYAKILK